MTRKVRKRSVLGPIEEDIFKHLSGGDFLMSVLLSGRSSRAFYKEARQRAQARFQYKRSIEGLQKRGLLHVHHDEIHLTSKGKELLEVLASRTSGTKELWKGRWWLVLYDIPVSMNHYRFELRGLLIRSGFRKLQHSVWIHFQPCRELEIFLRQNPAMSKFVRYVETLPFPDMESIKDWKALSPQ